MGARTLSKKTGPTVPEDLTTYTRVCALILGDSRMNGKLRKAGVLAIFLAIGACAKNSAEPAFEPDPILHPPGGRIVFNRMCVGTPTALAG